MLPSAGGQEPAAADAATRPIGLLSTWLDSRFLRGQRGPPDDVRFRNPAGHDNKENLHNSCSLSTAAVCSEIILPDTSSCKTSFTDWVCSNPPSDADDFALPVAGPATIFISHAWSYNFQSMLWGVINWIGNNMEAEQKKKGVYVWIDIFCINQHRIASDTLSAGSDSISFENVFQDRIKSIGHTVVVLDTIIGVAPLPFRRIWCCWEIFCTSLLNVPISMAFCSTNEIGKKTVGEAMAEAVADPAVLQEIVSLIKNTTVRDAQASFASDQSHILGLVDSAEGGSDAVDGMIHNALLSTLVSMFCLSADDKHAEVLQTVLHESPGISFDSLISGGFKSSEGSHPFWGLPPLLVTVLKQKQAMTTCLETEGASLSQVEKIVMSGLNFTSIGYSNDLLTFLPPWIVIHLPMLTNLQDLNLSSHALHDLPEEFGQLAQLRILNLAVNRFCDIPAVVLTLPRLECLNMDNNDLVEIPSELAQLSNLQLLSCLNNRSLSVDESHILHSMVGLHFEINAEIHCERDHALDLLKASFSTNPALGLYAEERLQVQACRDGTDLYYMALDNASATKGYGNAAIVCNVEANNCYTTQMGFHNYYWKHEGYETLGAPLTSETGGQLHPGMHEVSGAIQTFQNGKAFWNPDRGMYHELHSDPDHFICNYRGAKMEKTTFDLVGTFEPIPALNDTT